MPAESPALDINAKDNCHHAAACYVFLTRLDLLALLAEMKLYESNEQVIGGLLRIGITWVGLDSMCLHPNR